MSVLGMGGTLPSSAKPVQWENTKVSTENVQRTFVNCRLCEINDKTNADALTQDTLAALKKFVPHLANADFQTLISAYVHLMKRLHTADLTINFKAMKWFLTENHYESYAQMYERAIRADGTMVLDNKDSLNPAIDRAKADDVVTVPPAWMQAQQQDQQQQLTARRGLGSTGLSPNADLRGRLVNQISPGKLTKSNNALGDYDALQEFTASNFQFNAKTKQIFTGLNYGRRPHGSTYQYGRSHMVVKDHFKTNAIYFAGDTFLALMPGSLNSATHQISYNTIAALFIKANANLRRALIQSCVQDAALKDSDDADMLVEAHLFEKLDFTGNITQIYVSTDDFALDTNGNAIPWTGDQVRTIQVNARKFAQKHNAKLIFQ